jgi:predicted dinucleotide-binding enzyme
LKIAIFGTGNVGETLGTKLAELGHEVAMGSRTADNVKAAAWVKKVGGKASAGTFATAAKGAEMVFNCTLGGASLEALKLAGEGALDGKIIVDLANPLDFSTGTLTLSIGNTDSLGELIARTFPRAHVVKTLNTMWCGLMVNPRMLPEETVVFLAGNDAGAKAKVRGVLEGFGWRSDEMVDVGDITGARATEALMPIWMRLFTANKNNGALNFRIVKAK